LQRIIEGLRCVKQTSSIVKHYVHSLLPSLRLSPILARGLVSGDHFIHICIYPTACSTTFSPLLFVVLPVFYCELCLFMLFDHSTASLQTEFGLHCPSSSQNVQVEHSHDLARAGRRPVKRQPLSTSSRLSTAFRDFAKGEEDFGAEC